MGRGDLRAVGIVVDPVQRVQKAPDPRPKEGQRGAAQGPQERCLVGVIAPPLPDHDKGKGHHAKEGDHFE